MHSSVEPTERAGVYLAALLREAVPTLSLMDREPLSPTLGCMDRTYWAWKFTDFPGARFQEGLCFLSFLYSTPIDANPYYHEPKLLKWIAGGFDYWSSIQYRDGEFDEAYPFERSLAATAFTSFYMAEAWNMLDGALPPPTSDRFRQSLERAGAWLLANDEGHGFLSNHLAAAAAALIHIYRITGQARFAERSRYFIDKILDHQSSEGWYEEYGGADPGYQTHGSFYLARYWQLSDDPRLPASLERSFAFLAHFVHPDRSLGGEYASRNTQTYYPAAFEMFAAISDKACWIAETMLPSVQDSSAAGLGTVDVYNYFPLLNNYVFAYLACLASGSPISHPEPPSSKPGIVYFPEAGIVKVRRPRYDLVVGLSKGGVLKLFDRQRNKLVHNDCGYIGRLKNGRLFSSQWFEKDRRTVVAEDEIVIEGNFHEISRPIMRPIPFLGFRLFSLTLGRLPQFSYWLKALLVRTLIYRKRDLDLAFERRILLKQNAIEIFDRLQGDIAEQIDSLQWADTFTTIHMGSSRYFVRNELTISDAGTGAAVDVDHLKEGVVIQRTITLT